MSDKCDSSTFKLPPRLAEDREDSVVTPDPEPSIVYIPPSSDEKPGELFIDGIREEGQTAEEFDTRGSEAEEDLSVIDANVVKILAAYFRRFISPAPVVRGNISTGDGEDDEAYDIRQGERDDISATIGTITIGKNRKKYEFYTESCIIRKSCELVCAKVGRTSKKPFTKLKGFSKRPCQK